ncbi:MAG: Ig-like domain-containing protein [Solirubrobacterales bacterium]
MSRALSLGVLLVALASVSADSQRLVRATRETVAGDEEFRFRLSEGMDEGAPLPRATRAAGVPLDDAATQRVLSRLPAWSAPEDERPFALRESSLPAPRPGRTVKEPFPPPSEAGRPEAPDHGEPGPLRVLRRSPGGDVPLAPSLSVTFSQPMVAVTGHEDLGREARPVRLTPEPPGRWRWVGTRTLLFEPAGRFPMATDYRAEVPAGTRSAIAGGTALGEATAWRFTTPPPTVTASFPKGAPARREPLIFAAFDQRIDPQAVAQRLRVRVGATSFPVRLATGDEVAADVDVKSMAAGTEAGRWLAFRPTAPLPAGAEITVVVPAGTPSAEGPKTTAAEQTWSFQTFGPLKVTGHRCGWNDQCPPLSPWQIDFSNPIDAKAFRKDMVQVQPELPGLKVQVFGASLTISGASRGRTTYSVTLAAGVPDVFGQTLGQSATVSFTVGTAPERLFAPGVPFVVLDPAAGPRFSVYSVNHAALRVQAYAVGPEHLSGFQKYMQEGWRDKAVLPPGRRVLSTTVPVQGAPDTLTETRLDLAAVLPGGLGHAVLVVEPVRREGSSSTATVRANEWQQAVRVWVQSTRIGLAAFADDQSLVAWASALADGRPLPGVTIALGGALTPAVTTGIEGLATLALPAVPNGPLVARLGADVAILPESASWWGPGGWQSQRRADELRYFVFDDRHLYRPGEEVNVKGWVRIVGAGPQGDVGAWPDGVSSLTFRLLDSRGNEVAKGQTPLSAFGAFHLAIALPATMNLGPGSLTLDVPGGRPDARHVHAFDVQEFRRPEFEVKAALANEGPFLPGGHADVAVTAAYYAGGPLPGAEVGYRVAATPAFFTPPNRDDFSFGPARPWWEPRIERHGRERSLQYQGQTDAQGRHRLRIDLDGATTPRAVSLTAEATVHDVNRQAFTAAAHLLVHPALLYVGLRSERVFVQPGEALHVDAIATDLDGRAVPERALALRLERLDWEQVAGEWMEKKVLAGECRIASGAEPVRCTFRPSEGGSYRLTASLNDDAGRRNESELRLFVAGGKTAPNREVEQEKVTLVPDRKEYAAGDTARLLVLAPFSPAEGVLTLRRSGLLSHRRFAMAGASHTLEVKIEDAFTPGLHVQVDLVGASPRTDDAGDPDPKAPLRPAFAAGEVELLVPPRQRTLALRVTPRAAALEPGGATVLDVDLRDAAGRGVADGEVAVVVVDEAVLAVASYRLPDPLSVFYTPRGAGVSDRHLREHVVLGRPEDLSEAEDLKLDSTVSLEAMKGAPPLPSAAPAQMRSMAFGGAPRAKEAAAPIALRTDFKPLALFAARVPTDANGRAQVTVTLPDSLTRYRVMAVAAAGARSFGSGESTLTARLPLMVRPSPPRFLNFGDRFELPVVVQNQTGAALDVEVALRARNATVESAGRRVTVPANDRVEVRFPVAARQAGTARFQVGAASGRWADAAEVSLPVWTPATTEAFATYGQLDQGSVAQPVRAPAGALREFGGLELTTSSTALQALTDAVLYLVAYPFECAEQLSSRVLAVAALRDVLTAFAAEGLPKPEEMVAAVARDVARLRALQNPDGGFGFWRRGEASNPYVSIHAAHALERAKSKGFDVPGDTLDRARTYLREIDQRIPGDYPVDVRRTLVAYALHVRGRLGDADPARARKLVGEAGAGALSFEALGWVLEILGKDARSKAEAAAIRAHLGNRVTETAAGAHFVVSYGDGGHLLLHSNRRADAVLLDALIADQPASDLIPKLVEGLLAHRIAGRWGNTQENAFVLLALDRYFQAFEKTTPDFVARAWLGERYAGEQAFRGRSTDRRRVEVPMAAVPVDTTDLILAKDGRGRLYYRIGMRYAPSSLRLDPADHGFTVERVYEGADDKADVRRDAEGTWHVRAGTRVRVRLTMLASARRYHVALVDPLPAGLEALNPSLATTGTLPPDDPTEVTAIGAPGLGGPRGMGSWWWWTRPWFEHQNLRDERVEAFSSLLWEGVYTYSYVARATTPGDFVAPPPRAEEMYAPETFGRGGTDRVIVE